MDDVVIDNANVFNHRLAEWEDVFTNSPDQVARLLVSGKNNGHSKKRPRVNGVRRPNKSLVGLVGLRGHLLNPDVRGLLDDLHRSLGSPIA
jgi:hypothetical protein